jgi:flagellar biosynthesis protein FlhG
MSVVDTRPGGHAGAHAPAAPGMVSLAITSGKGGVGKTNVVVNLAVSLGRMRHRVVVLDADFGLGNVDVLLGLAPEAHLGHVLSG